MNSIVPSIQFNSSFNSIKYEFNSSFEQYLFIVVRLAAIDSFMVLKNVHPIKINNQNS
jgi:hypothetical protein